MEMCYDGALVMPSNYAVMGEEEMTYVDGGALTTAQKALIIAGAVASSFGISASATTSTIKWIIKNF